MAIGAQFHGTWSDLSDSDRERILDTLVDHGVTWVRIDVGWSMVQPKAGTMDAWGVALVDKVFRMARKRGLHILATFWRTPAWASGKTDRNVFPLAFDDYANALEWCARKWAGTVAAWEIWNEPNAAEFLDPPDPTKYAQLLRAAFPAVKRGDPNALVVFGGPMFVDTDWIARVYHAGGKPYFDVMAVHPYQGNAAKPPSDPDRGRRERLLHTDALLALMRGHADSRPVWFTEFGWSTHANTSNMPVWFLGVDEQTQARYLAESLELISKRYPQVTHAFWYTSRDLATGKVHQDNRGLMRKDFTPKPALLALGEWIRKGMVHNVYASDHSRGADASGEQTARV